MITGRRYKPLGDALLRALPTTKSQTWLAKELYVSPEAVHYWLSGKTRPEPGRLGRIAALLDLSPDNVAGLAGYHESSNAYEKLHTSYNHTKPELSIS